eukprot:Colp12_sorted_trinity150504_noHs@8017
MAAPKPSHVRLKKEFMKIMKSPIPYIVTTPLPSNILEWHYVISGPENTPYEGGLYHGKLVFPSEYPFKPPSIYMLTQSGRFRVNYRLCLSMSDYHPDQWNPSWSVASILTGLLSFMLENTPTTGSVETTVEVKRDFARKSHTANLVNPIFRELFPELCNSIMEEKKVRVTDDNRLEYLEAIPEPIVEVLPPKDEEETHLTGRDILTNMASALAVGVFALIVYHMVKSSA